MISFNIPPYVGTELDYVKQAVENHKICGDGAFTKQCNQWLSERFGSQKVLLTTSGTTALEMAALLCDLQPGDEVILPSFTFSSTATAFVLAGAQPGVRGGRAPPPGRCRGRGGPRSPPPPPTRPRRRAPRPRPPRYPWRPPTSGPPIDRRSPTQQQAGAYALRTGLLFVFSPLPAYRSVRFHKRA